MASKQLLEKVCPVCGDTFFTLDNQKTYCSAECRERRKLDCAHNKKPKTSICKWCHKEFLRGDNYKLRLCPECRDKAIKMGVKGISEKLDDVVWDDSRFIDRYGSKDVKAAREHEKMISADERVRRKLGVDTKQWGAYKDSHPDIFAEIRMEAGISEQKS